MVAWSAIEKVVVKKGSRAHQQTPKSAFGCASWRAASLRAATAAASRPSSTVCLIHHIQPCSLSPTPSRPHLLLHHTHRLLCKEAPFPPRLTFLHNRQHGFGGNYDCVRLACHPLTAPCADPIYSVDNSESSRNGDYVPSRWDAQADAANLIFQYKTQANPESSVGLMTMGATGPEVLTTLTTNPAKILDGLHRTKIRGESHLHTAIMIASVRCIKITTHTMSLIIPSSPLSIVKTRVNANASSSSPARR